MTVPPGRYHYIQIADAAGEIPDTAKDLIHTARENRLMPGEGDLDLRGIIRQLPAGIPVAVEIPNARLAARMSDEARAKLAYDATHRLLETVSLVTAGRTMDERGQTR